MVKQRLTKLTLIAAANFLLLFSQCSSKSNEDRYSGKSTSLGGAQSSGFSGAPVRSAPQVQLNPWEFWQTGLGNRGDQLSSVSILDGDAQLQRGDRSAALAAYQRALTQGLRPNEAEANQYRLLAMQLSLGQNDAVLKGLSDYFRSANRSVDAVGPDFSLLFGYAYAFRGDTDQAFAWLGRANNNDRPNGVFAGIAQSEITALTRTVSEAKFEDTASTWDSNDFIHVAFSRERARRAHGGAVEVLQPPNAADATGSQIGGTQQSVQVGVLLPLSGRFAALGRNVENGIELAVEGQGGVGSSVLAVQDTGETPASAMTAAQTLFSAKSPSIVLGPLISEQAGVVRSITDSLHVPSISFSKRSDFSPGGSVFRLGVTNETQIDSLLGAARDHLGIMNIAIIHPADLGSQEITDLVKIRAHELGVTVAYEGTYAHDDPKGAAAVAVELETQKVEGVFFSGSSAVAANVYAGLPDSFRKRARPMGIANWDNTNQLMNSRTVLKGAIFVSPFFAHSKRPIVQGFVTSFTNKFNQAPDFLAAQGFDAATLALQALHMSQQNNTDIVSALRSVESYEGLTGKVYIGADGELRRAFPVLELRDTDVVELGDTSAPTAPSGASLPVDASPTPVVAPPAPL